MNWKEVQGQLQARYYEWACREWDTERASDFRRLRSTRTRAAEQLLEALKRLPPDAVGVAISALTKRAHADVLPFIRESLGPREESVLAQLDTFRHLWANKHPAQKSTSQASTRQLIPAFRERLSMLGEAMDVDSAGEWRYITDIHGYTIHTYVELDGRHP